MIPCIFVAQVPEQLDGDLVVFSMIEVRTPESQGDVIWPDQLVNGEDADEEEDDGSEKIDVQYKDVFGEAPPDTMSYQDKYNKIAIDLFGDLGDEGA